MDISIIKPEEVTTSTGIAVGDPQAPKQLLEFINAACPYSKKWFEESFPLLQKAVNEGKIQRYIKLFDKNKESLQPGNIMHRYVPANGEDALLALSAIFDTQNSWKNLPLTAVADYAENTLHLTVQDSDDTLAVIEEAERAVIQFVPTVILGNHIFDESITSDELLHYIEEDK